MYFVYYICTEKLRLPLWSCQNVLRILHHTTLACTEKLRLSSRSWQSVLRILLKSCYFPAGAAKMYFVYYTCTESCDFQLGLGAGRVYFAYYTCTEKSRLSSQSCQNTANRCRGKKPILTDTEAEGYKGCPRGFFSTPGQPFDPGIAGEFNPRARRCTLGWGPVSGAWISWQAQFFRWTDIWRKHMIAPGPLPPPLP